MTISPTSILCTIRSSSFYKNLLRSSKTKWLLCLGFLSFAQLSSSQCTDPVVSLDSTPGNCLNGLNLKASGGYTAYRWFLDGTEVYGEIDSILNTYFYGNGDYRVIGTGGVCAPSDTSAIYNVLCEICGNGIDDDGDGLIDCDDSDCADYQGCTDCDGDGVVDNEDYCFCDGSMLLSLNTYGCGFPDSCAFKVTDTVSIDTTGVNYQSGYITVYILADSLGEIADTSLVPSFTNISPGKYMIVAIDYEDDGSITNLVVGNDLNTVFANCYDLSNALTFKVCPEEDCGDGIDNDDDGLVDCDDPDCAPVAGINVNQSTACVEDNFSFISDSTIVGATYSWTFGNGSTPATAVGVGAHFVSYSTCGTKEIILNVLENGCTVSDTIYVDVIDNVNPTFTVPADVTVYLDASCMMDTIPGILGIPTNVSDDCASIPSVNYSNDFTNLDECNTTGSFDRIWTVTDNCGNDSIQIQTITVLDTIAPIFIIPNDTTLYFDASCSVDTSATIAGAGIPSVENDNCGSTTTTFSNIINSVSGCSSGFEIKRTWSITDDCGNVTRDTQTITVLDTVAPIVVFPIDTTLYLDANCLVNVDSSLTGSVSVTNNCGSTTTSFRDSTTSVAGCNSGYELSRMWEVLDDCGNVTRDTQTIMVLDTVAPILTGVPADTTVECDAIPTAPIIGVGGVTASDNCDTSVTIIYSENIITLACGSTIERTWTATDDCGNATIQTQTITVEDTTAPSLSGVPADTTVECDAIPTAPVIGVGGVTSSDNCDTSVTIIFSENIITNPCGSTIERTWTATDDCGNSVSQTQTVMVEDTQAPILLGIPSDIIASCDASSIPPVATGITATDNCDTNVDISFSETIIPGICPDNYTIERTWTATDNCGNAVSLTQQIIIEDNALPIFVNTPSNETVACDAIPSTAIVTATDDCDTDVEITFSESILASNCTDGYELERTWIATDNCGNVATYVQIIIVSDTQAPILVGVPLDVTANCDVSSIPPVATGITAIDNCDTDVEISFIETIISTSCPDDYTIQRTWTATDNCGNTVSSTQQINVGDSTPPTFVNTPSNETVACDAIPSAAIVTAIDDCDTDVDITFSEALNNLNCPDGYEIERTWVATDNCGNSASYIQVITVTDTQAPILFGVPSDVIASCDGSGIPPVATGITGTDNCDTNVEISFTETIISGSCLDSYIIERTWTASDNCGNTVSETQQIIVGDNSPPVITANISDATIECDETIPLLPEVGTDILISDDCDNNLTIDFSETTQPGSCEGSSIITREWIVSDNCGNQSSLIQEITIVDNSPPVLDPMPSDISISCNQSNSLPNPPNITATDNCDIDVTVTYDEEIIPGACPSNYIVVRTWTATDDCGNSTSGSYTIEVGDYEDPILIGIPNDITVDLGAGQSVPNPPNNIFANDNCDFNVDIDFYEFQVQDACAYTIYREWEAMDDCGNFTQATQVITVFENLSLTIVPQNAFICIGGQVTFAVEPYDPSYTYLWTASSGSFDDPNSETPIYTATQSGAITINVNINLGGGCYLQTSLTVDEGLAINGTIGNNGPLCLGEDLQLTANGGDSYVWLDPSGNVFSTEQNPIISNVNSTDGGVYTVQISTPTCYQELTTNVEVLSGLLTSISTTDQTCDEMGSIEVSVASGAEPFTFIWSPNITDSSSVAAGIYNVIVSDANGCSNVFNNILIDYECNSCDTPVIDLVTIIPASCEENNGAISISMEDQSVNYVYDWGATYGNTNTIFNVPAGNYPVTISVLGNSNCQIDTSFTIESIGSPTVTIIDIQPAECFAPNGSVTLSPDSLTYIWSDGGGGYIRNNLSTGTYTVLATDVMTGCSDTIIIEIDSVNNLIVATDIIQPTCVDTSGTITLNVSGGSGEYIYNWSNGNITNAADSLISGTYNITITDFVTGCETTETVILNSVQLGNAVIVLADTLVYLDCFGDVNGTLDYFINYAPDFNHPATVVITDGTNVFQDDQLPVGNYCIQVTDANGCEITEECFEVVQPTELQTNISVANQVCDTLGMIELIPNGGTSPYTYQWMPNVSDSSSAVNLTAGNISVTITDANGCEQIVNPTVFFEDCEPCVAPEIFASQITNATCNSDNGSINIEMVGGNANYEFVWANNVSDTSFANNLAAGIYEVTISAIGDTTCVLETSFTIEAIAPTIVQVISITPDSCDLGIGNIVLSPDSLNFVWSNGSTNANADSLIAGSYNVTATDANGCEFILQNILIGNSCDTLTCELPQIAAIITNEDCGNGQGSIEIGIIGNVDNYNFIWTPNIGDSTFVNNLNEGTYQLSIQNILDATCALDTSFTVGNNIVEPVAAVVSNQPASCAGSNGRVIFQPINLIYDWGNGVFGFSNENLAAGSYDVTVSDSSGCSIIITVVVASENPLEAIADVTQAGCDGGTTGSAGIEVNNGVGDFDFIWNDGNTDSLRIDLALGNYSVTVTDNGTGCTATTSFIIIQVTPGEATLMLQDTIVYTTCVGSDDGEVQFFANYSPFFQHPASMILTNSTTGAVETNGDLSPGNYCITIEDANGCFITEKCFEVIEPAQISITTNVIGVSCTSNGSISINNVTGGTPGYTYDWGHIVGTDDPQNLVNLPAGSYDLTVTDAVGCLTELVILVPDDCGCIDPQIALIEVDEENCSMANGAIEITMQGAISNYNFDWSITGGGNTPIANNLIAGDYTVTIADANNPSCFIVHNITVQAIDGLIVDMITSPADCNESNGQVTLEPSSYIYEWEDGIFGNTRNDLAEGTYTITATDGGNCATEYDVVIVAEANCLTTDTLYFTTFVNISIDTICIDLSELPGTFGATLPCSDPANGTVIINSLDSCLTYIPDPGFIGQDTSCVVACDQNGVCDTTIIIINVIPDCDDFITTSSVNLNTDNCDSLFNICLEIPFADISNYSITRNGANYNGSLDSCDNSETQIQLGVGTHQMIFTENTTGCQDTVIVWITCNAPPCVDNNIITEDSITIYTNDCNEPGDYCLDVSLDNILNYTIMSNGELYNDLFGGCDFDSIVSYSFFVLPGQGNFGPYQLDSWMLNGEVHTTTFMTISELVSLMNIWDPISEWVFDPSTFMITGGNTQNNFGQMLITQINTGATAVIEVNANLEPTATEIYLDPGINEVIVTNNITGCIDTVTVTVTCVGLDILMDTILVNTIDTMCIPTDELMGTIVSYENDCEDSSGEFVIFSQIDGEWCVQYEGVEVGVDSACVVICDDLGICDTTYLYVTVVEPIVSDTLPDAVADVDTLRINTSTIVEVMVNDSINGTFDTVYILQQPTFGTAIMDSGGTITYTPNEDYCDTAIPDEMTYVLCNTSGCDTTTVSFYVTCSDLIIYTGFSPNGDGVNDLFYIEGVENFPNNELNIFNRWGNEVYFEKGYLNTWDGTWNGKILPDGTYFYVFQYENGGGETIEESGYIQIHR